MLATRASSITQHYEAESGTIAGCATKITNAGASQGSAITFGNDQTCAAQQVGAQLPISYNLGALSGTLRYVSTSGNDQTGTGTAQSPYATLTKAVASAVAGDSIVVRGGTYRSDSNIAISSTKPLTIIAYPGETPIFSGSRAVASNEWTTENSYKYASYTAMPVTDGSGITFTTGQNLNGNGIGKYPDQAWIGSAQLKQVATKAEVVDGTFYVDSTNGRLYMTATDANKANVEISSRDIFIVIRAPGTRLEGLKITRFSNTPNLYGVVRVATTADGSTLKNVEVSDSAFIGIFYEGSSDLNKNNTLTNVTVTRSNWMGVSAMYTDDLTLDKVLLSDMDQFDEFASSPQSGGMKTSRTWRTKVLNSTITNNKSQGLWFDQSNYDIQLANNTITDNADAGVFFEISDNLLMINNYIRASGGSRAVKLAGSSGLKLINNTIIGGADPVGIYVDNRSIAGCADSSQPLCANSYNSDRDSVRTRPATLDWMPRVDLMLNNIIAYPDTKGYCPTTAPFCITKSNGTATAAIDDIIHQADASRGIPQTRTDGNVYANGSGSIIDTSVGAYTQLSTFTSAMAGAPVSIPGLETNGKFGNSLVNTDGSPTASLTAIHNQAVAIPTDAAINAYIPAGTKHFGVLYK